MKRHCQLPVVLLVLLLLVPAAPSCAGFLDELLRGLDTTAIPAVDLDDATIAKGLKEALDTGTRKAVAAVAKQNGYFDNQAIKILLPENLRPTAELIVKFGFKQEVDDFILGMNRAAEKAAPLATEHFTAALKAMTFDDARKILQGDNTSATEYFRQKTGEKIYTAFKPIVSKSLKDVGAVQSYQQMMARFNTIPFARGLTGLDLDHYVTDKAVEGLFKVIGEEEKQIRTDPAARGSELLQKVFKQ